MAENRGLFTSDKMQAYLAEEPAMETQQLADHIWTVSDGQVRTLFLAGDSGVIAFDTFGTPGRARAFRAAIEAAVPGKPINHLIYTHDHLDHAGFAADLAPNAEIIADEMCANVIRLREAEGQLVPTRTLSGHHHELEIDGVSFQLINPGPTHGTGNLSTYFPDARILFSSDTILTNAKYGLMPDYHIANFVKFMRELAVLDFDTFVPGRYGIGDKSAFTKGCDYIEAIQIASQEAFVEMVPIWVMDAMQGYVGEKLRSQFGDLDGYDQHIGLTSIRIVHHYLMGGWGLEDTPTPDYLLADEL
ncbi:MAG: MBL fold metallo-hydrolase [Gammaproteobacteria bacterium]|nr:MBL fold metallo-hydrolase [Gammaproteobacteria bacterium]